MMKPFDPKRLVLIHGLEGSSQGDKAVLLRGLFPQILTPDFIGPVSERMTLLYSLLGESMGWTIVGSSLGGLMAALFTCQRPAQVRKLILLAPALFLPEFAAQSFDPVDVPTVVYHGVRDDLVPIDPTRQLAEKVFKDLTFNTVDDDHRLFATVHSIDWKTLVYGERSQ